MIGSRLRTAALAALLGFVALAGGTQPLSAQEKAGVRPGFEYSQIKGEKIVLFRPTIKVGEQSMAGLYEPRAEWTDEARGHMDAELKRAQQRLSNEVTTMPEYYGEDAQLVAEYEALFAAVAGSVVEFQFFRGNRLPTLKNGDFDWTLGTGTKRLAELTGARYGLFIYTEDHYGSTGRKMLQVAAAGLLGVGVTSGVHIGYAGLVDLQTGDLLWLNADAAMGGDVRDAEGMVKRVDQLLEDFPGSKPAPTPAPAS